MVEIAGLEPLLDPALLAFDRDAVRAGHHRRERLRAAHPAEARGEDPLARKVAAIMLAAHLDEGLVGALNDALGADVDPRPGGHLAVHHQALAIEFVEMVPGRPLRHEVRIGDQHARRVRVGAEHADRLARLDQQGLVAFEPRQRLDDPVVAFPVARGAADAAIDDQLLGRLGDLRIEIVHQHPHRGLGRPALGGQRGAGGGADVAAIVASVQSSSLIRVNICSSLRGAERRSNPACTRRLDCFAALAMTITCRGRRRCAGPGRAWPIQ